MALSMDELKQLAKCLSTGEVKTATAFGYPIVLAPQGVLEKLFGMWVTEADFLPESYAEKARGIHGVASKRQLVRLEAILHHFGVELNVYDIKDHYGVEKYIDLNNPVPLIDPSDLVIDPGTMEHVFFTGQALKTIYESTKPGGYILHECAPNAPNHGLWNPQEKMFLRFYRVNNCEILYAMKRNRGEEVPLHFTEMRRPRDTFPETRGTVFIKKGTQQIMKIPVDY